MPNFTAGTSFGAKDTVTNTKLYALIADATINPECSLSINSGTIGTLGCTRGTVATFNSTTGTVATLNTTTGSVQTLSAGTLATNLTGGTYSGLINSSTGTYSGLINSSTGTFTGSLGGSCNFTSGTIGTLTANTLTGTLTGGTYSGSIGTARSFTAGTINNFTSSSNASISGFTIGTGNPAGSGSGNTAVGSGTLGSNTTGNLNTAFGLGALQSNTSGSFNTASGNLSLASDNPIIVVEFDLIAVLAEFPRTIVFDAVAPPEVLVAPFPINVLFVPEVLEDPARYPIAVFETPVVSPNAAYPNAPIV